MPSESGHHAQFVFQGLQNVPALIGTFTGTQGTGWMVTFPRTLLRQQLSATVARTGYRRLRVDKKDIYSIVSVTLKPMGFAPFNAWIVVPVGTDLSMGAATITLMVYRSLTDIVVPVECKEDFVRRWAAEVMLPSIEDELRIFSAKSPETCDDPEELMSVQRQTVEAYTKAFRMTLPAINLVLDTPFNRTVYPRWKASPVMEEPIRVYTLPDGSILTIKPSGPLWEQPPPYPEKSPFQSR